MSGWKGEKRRIRSWIGDLLYQEETVITFTVKDITIQDMNKAGRVTSLLSPVEYKDLVGAAGDIRVYWILLFFFFFYRDLTRGHCSNYTSRPRPSGGPTRKSQG